jgi:hypothetical protein
MAKLEEVLPNQAQVGLPNFDLLEYMLYLGRMNYLSHHHT